MLTHICCSGVVLATLAHRLLVKGTKIGQVSEEDWRAASKLLPMLSKTANGDLLVDASYPSKENEAAGKPYPCMPCLS